MSDEMAHLRAKVEVLSLDTRQLLLERQETFLAMQRMQHHINELTDQKMAIATELVEAREAINRVVVAVSKWADHENGWLYIGDVTDALRGEDDDV